ncbi:hypothetical protein EYF80_027915 [Liparis tanakae]|uniref:Uncharacterized protein n=1 Tax=Liparis tanakae TaxID=230148 RepID=A0A4Z2H7V9_9TELE|nr:hypothetical protein EYF80_027915 [Liparis tanakae]
MAMRCPSRLARVLRCVLLLLGSAASQWPGALGCSVTPSLMPKCRVDSGKIQRCPPRFKAETKVFEHIPYLSIPPLGPESEAALSGYRGVT